MEGLKENKSTRPKGRRYYVVGSIMNVEEDRTHEFKGHRNIAIEEIPPWCIDANDSNRKTRNCISRNICGFLNSGFGGIIYLGVLDDGSVEGILLTRYQRDHILLSLKDTLQRFRPPVPSHLVTIEFIPCINNADVNFKQVANRHSSDKKDGVSDKLIKVHSTVPSEMLPGLHDATSKSVHDNSAGGWDWVVEKVDETNIPKEIKFKNDSLRMRPHGLRTYKQCWCDYDAFTRVSHGHKSPAYVIEIAVKPPNAKDPEIRKHLPPSSDLLLQPIFQTEDGSIYVRKDASLTRRSFQDMTEEAIEDVQRMYFPILKEAAIHLGILEELVKKVELLNINGKDSDDTAADGRCERSLVQRIKQILL